MIQKEQGPLTPAQYNAQRTAYLAAWSREFGYEDNNRNEAAIAYDNDPSCWPDPDPYEGCDEGVDEDCQEERDE